MYFIIEVARLFLLCATGLQLLDKRLNYYRLAYRQEFMAELTMPVVL
jgi:hypothetical protein